MATLSIAIANQNQDIELNFIQSKIKNLEVSSGGRLGISAINTANNMHIEYRAEQRFPFQSTFKLLVVSAILKQSMADTDLLEEKVIYKQDDLVFWSPITEKYISAGMTVSELSAAAMMHSDNTATNLLMRKLGGTEAVTAFAHSLENHTFRLDHWETELNSNPDVDQDTSTPLEMRESLQKLVLGNILAAPQQEQLVTWMKGNTTGDKRIRAGVPKGWIVGDKTGGGTDYGMTHDIGIIWPPNCAPLVIAVYLVQNQKNAVRREDIVASVTRLLVNEFAKNDPCIKETW